MVRNGGSSGPKKLFSEGEKMSNRFFLSTAVACFCVLSSEQSPAAVIQLMYSTIDGDPSAVIPGGGGMTFRNLWRPYRSPNGQNWAMRANADSFDGGQLLFAGSGDSGQAVLLRGDPVPGGAPGEFVTNVDHQLGIRDDGTIAFGVNTSFGGGPEPSPDEYILSWDGNTFQVLVSEDQSVPGFVGVTYGASLLDVHILNDGTIGFRSINSIGLPSDSDTLLLLGSTLVAHEKVTIPAGQAVGGMQPWDFFEFDGYYHSADGTDTLIFGDLEGDSGTDGVVVVNGNVVIQEGSLIFPLSSPVGSGFTGLRECAMMTNGDWFARGGNANGQDWVVRNSAVVAATDLPITTGNSEDFDDAPPFTETFFMQAGNNIGDYVVGGTTDNADDDLDSVVVLNGSTVVMREGEAVDLDGDCLTDDDLFLGEFENDEAFLTDGLFLYFNAGVRNGAGTELGVAFMRVCVSTLDSDLDCDGDRDVDDVAAFVAALLGSPADCIQADRANLNGDASLDGKDVEPFVTAFLTP
ncbi:MAG: hypothetical protein MI923_19825 [Phycisphaerales bacterium]|nr:hypothetical protein [Phycisphaerales bacterium]